MLHSRDCVAIIISASLRFALYYKNIFYISLLFFFFDNAVVRFSFVFELS